MASLHKQLNAFEWCDQLTGQTDRHVRNYHVEINGDHAVVAGIDNDFAFGEKQTKLLAELSQNERAPFWVFALPQLIDSEALEKLRTANFDEHLKSAIKGPLSDKESDASRVRFETVKKHALKLGEKNLVVKGWGAGQSPDEKKQSVGDYLAGQRANISASLFDRNIKKLIQPTQ